MATPLVHRQWDWLKLAQSTGLEAIAWFRLGEPEETSRAAMLAAHAAFEQYPELRIE